MQNKDRTSVMILFEAIWLLESLRTRTTFSMLSVSNVGASGVIWRDYDTKYTWYSGITNILYILSVLILLFQIISFLLIEDNAAAESMFDYFL